MDHGRSALDQSPPVSRENRIVMCWSLQPSERYARRMITPILGRPNICRDMCLHAGRLVASAATSQSPPVECVASLPDPTLSVFQKTLGQFRAYKNALHISYFASSYREICIACNTPNVRYWFRLNFSCFKKQLRIGLIKWYLPNEQRTTEQFIAWSLVSSY